MARIGVYGGTFNPIHNTHIEIAEYAKKQFNLDSVIFLVAGTPPHKNTAESISDINRLNMVKIAISNHPDFMVDDREIYRAGKSYSYLTFSEYHKEYSDDELFFIMGSDSLINFKNWVKPDIISEYANILVAPRIGDDLDSIEKAVFECKNLFEGDFFIIDYKANDLASSTIRQSFIENMPFKEQLNPRVIDYITQHNLYCKYNYTF